MIFLATRRERVILELEDRFSNPTLRAAAAAKVLDKSLGDIDGSVTRTGTSANAASRDLDRFSGRLSIIRDVALTLGPALVPIGAVAIPAVTGLAAQFGAAAVAGGTMVVAFQGVGETLEAVNKAALEPTTENLEAARIALEGLSPQAAQFVTQLQDMRPQFVALRDAAAAGLFPGLMESLDNMLAVMPRLEGILNAVGDAAGDLAVDLSEGLAGPRGQRFLAFIQAEVPSALATLGETVGNIAAGMAELWQAFTPLNNDFASWMLRASEAFDQWSQGLSQTDGFKDFVSYIRENGPRVGDALGAIGSAVLEIVQAMAPLGGPSLAALEMFADTVAAIAGSSYGPTLFALAAGLVAVNRALKGLDALRASSLFRNLAAEAGGTAGKLTRLQGAGIAAAAGLTVAATAGNKLVDIFREDLPGVEQLTGMLMDLSNGAIGSLPSEFDSLAESIERINNPSFWKGQATSDTVLGFLGMEGRTLTNARDEIEALEASLVNLLQLEGPQAAEAAFDRIAEGAKLSAEETERLRDLMPSYVDALAGAENQARATGEAGAAGGRQAAAGLREAKSAAQEFADAMQRTNRILEGRSAVVDYEQAVDDMTKSIKENGRTLDANTQKGRNNRNALDNMASSAVALSQQMRVGNRLPFLEKARGDIVDAAMKLGRTREQANNLADRLLQIDKLRVNPDIQVKTAKAQGDVEALLSAMAQIRDRTVTVTTVFTESGRKFKDFDSGGYTGPGHYKEPRGIVHAGEVVIPQNLVQRDWSMLSSRYGHLPGFDSGGLVPRASTSMRSWPNLRAGSSPWDELDRGVTLLTHSLSGFDYALVDGNRSLKSLLKLRNQELEASRERLDAEKDALSALKDARRSLAEEVSGNFRSSLFGGTDLRAAYESGALGSQFGQDLLAWVQQSTGMGAGNLADHLDDYLATLTQSQLQALQGQATSGTLRLETQAANQFQQLLEQLDALGLDGGLFSELAASGNVGAAEYYASLSRREIRQLERQYDRRNAAAQAVGGYAGSAAFKDDIRQQTRVFVEARDEFRAARKSLERAERRAERMERLAKDNPKDTGRETASALNGASSSASRRG